VDISKFEADGMLAWERITGELWRESPGEREYWSNVTRENGKSLFFARRISTSFGFGISG